VLTNIFALDFGFCLGLLFEFGILEGILQTCFLRFGILLLKTVGSHGAEARGEVGGNTVDSRIYFRDCGSLGKQTLSIDASEVLVRFKTGQASLAQRGFLLYFEGAKTNKLCIKICSQRLK